MTNFPFYFVDSFWVKIRHRLRQIWKYCYRAENGCPHKPTYLSLLCKKSLFSQGRELRTKNQVYMEKRSKTTTLVLSITGSIRYCNSEKNGVVGCYQNVRLKDWIGFHKKRKLILSSIGFSVFFSELVIQFCFLFLVFYPFVTAWTRSWLPYEDCQKVTNVAVFDKGTVVGEWNEKDLRVPIERAYRPGLGLERTKSSTLRLGIQSRYFTETWKKQYFSRHDDSLEIRVPGLFWRPASLLLTIMTLTLIICNDVKKPNNIGPTACWNILCVVLTLVINFQVDVDDQILQFFFFFFEDKLRKGQCG